MSVSNLFRRGSRELPRNGLGAGMKPHPKSWTSLHSRPEGHYTSAFVLVPVGAGHPDPGVHPERNTPTGFRSIGSPG